ncbi:MAG: T9SS type B sorting domain-containing protein, partial [Flavobacterium sp.]
YSFHDTQDEANRNTNKINDEILYVDKFNPTTAPLTRFLRVQSVVDATKVTINPFLIKVKPEPATLEDRVTGRPDQYKFADSNGNATFVLLQDKNQLYYGNSNTELFKVDGVSKTKLTDAEIDKFTTNKNQLIEAKIVLGGEIATRQFTLYVEKLKVSGVNPILESIEVRSDKDNRYGSYDLKKAIPALLAAGENPDYYTITFHKTKAEADEKDENKRNPIDISKPYEGAHNTDVTARISYKLAKSANPIVTTSQKVIFKVIDKPHIPALKNVTYCDSKIASYSLTIDGQTKVIADGRTIATDEEMAKPDFDPKGKFSIGYFNSEEDAIANTNKIVGVEITVKLNEARKIWTRLTNLEDKNFNTSFFYASLGYDTLNTVNVAGTTFPYCQIETNDGKGYTVNLRTFQDRITGVNFITPANPGGSNTSVAYYESEADALSDKRMPESKVTAYPINMGEKIVGIFARVVMVEGFNCMADNFTTFNISLSTRLVIDYFPKETNQQLCINTTTNEVTPVVLSVENKDAKGRAMVVTWQREYKRENGLIFFENLPGIGNVTSIDIKEPGTYRAVANFAIPPYPGIEACGGESTMWTVIAPPTLLVDGVDATGMVNSMEIDEKGETMITLNMKDGNDHLYEYALDNGGFQSSKEFYNVSIGEHVAYARNKTSGCSASVPFSVFGYPKYFTPNGDGYNDTWNIPGLKGHNEARIYIYDRSGRLLKQLSPHTEGWDGTWNGKAMPSTDYWFTVEFVNDYKAPNEKNGQKVSYKGHFSLKR